MRNAIILHGLPNKDDYYNASTPSESNAHWIPWLQKQLIIHDIKTDAPEMFKSYDPRYDEWVKEIERYDITPESILVGHSMGGGFWLRYLSERPKIRVNKVVLIAPWLNIGRKYDINFFDFTLDNHVTDRIAHLSIFESDNDRAEVQETVAHIKQFLRGAIFHSFHNYGHFTYKRMRTTEFPELANEILIDEKVV